MEPEIARTLTTEQAIDKLFALTGERITPNSLRYWVRQGYLPCERNGMGSGHGFFLFAESDLQSIAEKIKAGTWIKPGPKQKPMPPHNHESHSQSSACPSAG